MTLPDCLYGIIIFARLTGGINNEKIYSNYFNNVGIAFGNNEAILFKHGRVEKFLPIDNIVNTFVGIVEEMANAIE